jgi:hypothetical protein
MKHNNQIDLQTKNVDSKGRIVLGKQFANRTAIVQYMDDGDIVIRLARIIPESEAWLYENEQALNLLRQGLKEAQELDFSSNPPELERSFTIASPIYQDG